MALQLKQSLTLTQQLIMTPQLQQAIKLLQLSRLELLETVTQEMETNPMLEEQPSDRVEEDRLFEEEGDMPDRKAQEVTIKEQARDDMDWEAYLSEYNTGWADSPYEAKDLPTFENIRSTQTSLYSHLMWQLNMNHCNEVQKQIGIHIIGNVDEDGYLKTSVEDISHVTGHSPEEVTETLKQIQQDHHVTIQNRI